MIQSENKSDIYKFIEVWGNFVLDIWKDLLKLCE